MLFLSLQVVLAVLATASALILPDTSPSYDTFDNVTVYTAPSNWKSRGTLYGRVVLLNQNCENDSVLLSTWTVSAPNKTYLPIYKSNDLGRSWTELSKVFFKTSAYTGIAQPFLYELGQSFGTYPAGTILLTGNAFTRAGTAIELHASLDKGYVVIHSVLPLHDFTDLLVVKHSST